MIKGYERTDKLTNNAISRVAFATEKSYLKVHGIHVKKTFLFYYQELKSDRDDNLHGVCCKII